jgi:hypothetical protein
LARLQIDKTIDGKKYTIGQKTPSESLKQLTKLIKLAGIPLAKALDIKSIKSMEKMVEEEFDFSELIISLVERLDEDDVLATVIKILDQTLASPGGECDKHFDTIFQGNLRHLMNVVIAALRVEYDSFFKDSLEQK